MPPLPTLESGIASLDESVVTDDDSTDSTVLSVSSQHYHHPLDSAPSTSGYLSRGSRGSTATPPSQRSNFDSQESRKFDYASVAPKPRSSIYLQELQINKLQYDAIGVVGRERETGLLQDCMNGLLSHQDDKQNMKELVFVHGYSGVGKTTLVRTLQQQSYIDTGSSQKKALFAWGKFDFCETQEEPYSGIATAFGDICQQLSKNFSTNQDKEAAHTLQKMLLTELGAEAVQLMIHIIPELAGLVPVDTVRQDSEKDKGESRSIVREDFQVKQEQRKFAFRTLTRVLGSFLEPDLALVLVLDDLQWADSGSLDVIDMLLSDNQSNSNSLMIIGCYRSNEVAKQNVLSTKITDWLGKQSMFNFQVTDVSVGNLTIDCVNKVLMALLSIDDHERTRGLAEICFKRTGGNPFFLIEFVSMLKDRNLLEFNIGLLKWMWNESSIEKDTMSTENVVDLLRFRMKKLTPRAQDMLRYAACLGTPFTVSNLSLIWNEYHQSNSGEEESIDAILQLLELEYFIEKRGRDTWYQWSHDKIREAALSLHQASDEASFQFNIGKILYRTLDERELEDALFDVTNLINRGPLETSPEFAQLNLRSAEKARHISAFQSSASYVSSGIRLLPSDKWITYRELTLRLYSLGAEMALASGHEEAMEGYINEVLSRHDLSALEKLPIYLTQLQKLCDVDVLYEETIALCKTVLKELGYRKMSRGFLTPVKAIWALLQTVKLVKKTPPAKFESLQLMNSDSYKATMLVLNRIFYASFHISDAFMLVLSTCGMVKLTIDHGISGPSGQAFVILGALAHALLGDFKCAARFTETALLIQRYAGSKYFDSNVLFTAYNGPMMWTTPLQTSFPIFLEAYHTGMQSGNVEYAMWSIHMHNVCYSLMAGRPLQTIKENCESTIIQMEDLKQSDQAVQCRIWWQLVLNLIGEAENAAVLKGDAFDMTTFAPHAKGVEVLVGFIKASALLYAGEHEAAAASAIKRGGEFLQSLPGVGYGPMETFQRGMALYIMARRTGKSIYSRPAKKVLSTMECWVKQGNPNVQHYKLLLSAEQAALNKDYQKSQDLYLEAIKFAARTGYLQEAALANERYADLLSHPSVAAGDDEVKHRLIQAINFYRDWGADSVVQRLEKQLMVNA